MGGRLAGRAQQGRRLAGRERYAQERRAFGRERRVERERRAGFRPAGCADAADGCAAGAAELSGELGPALRRALDRDVQSAGPARHERLPLAVAHRVAAVRLRHDRLHRRVVPALDAAEELFGEDLWPYEWPPGGEVPLDGAVHRPVVYTARMFAPPDGDRWGPVWALMRDLAAVHGDENVRLIVWFG